MSIHDPCHDTPHPHAPRGYIQHVLLRRVTPKGERATRWHCEYCGVPHEAIEVPAGHPAYAADCPSAWIVATEARPCPASFERPCSYCGRCYECAPDCAGMAMILGGMVPGVHVAGSVPVTPGDA